VAVFFAQPRVLLGFAIVHQVCFLIVCGCLQVEVDVVFELSNQKARCFLVLITLKQLLHEYARKVFGEISVRT
jgi:hypothetical protein